MAINPLTDTLSAGASLKGGAPKPVIERITEPGARAAAAPAVSVPEPVAVKQTPPPPKASELLERTVAAIRHAVEQTGTQLNFAVDRDSNQIVVKVMDAKTQEIIRQIPAEEFLKIAKDGVPNRPGWLLQEKG